MNSKIEIAPDNTPAYVDPFPGRSGDELEFDPCTRCGGAGHLAGYEHVDGGVCYGCNGTKGQDVQIRVLRARESGRLSTLRAAHKKWVKRAELHNANVDAVVAVEPAAEGWGEAISEDSFLLDLWTKAFDYELSEKQIAAVAATFSRRAARAASKAAEAEAAAPVPEGRYELEGEVVTVKTQESAYGDTLKMIVKADAGYKVWLTIPEALWTQLEEEAPEGTNGYALPLKGRRVRLVVTVEASRDDKAFGFGKRPTKAVLLPAAAE